MLGSLVLLPGLPTFSAPLVTLPKIPLPITALCLAILKRREGIYILIEGIYTLKCSASNKRGERCIVTSGYLAFANN